MDSFAEFMEMGVSAALARRKSCRKFATGEIPSHHEQLLKSASLSAPHASGGPRSMLFKRPEKDMAPACFNQKYVDEASMRYLFCGRDPNAVLRSGHPKYIFDCATACMCMDLMAVALGYGTCWIGHFDPERIKILFDLGDTLIPTIILLVGRRNDDRS